MNKEQKIKELENELCKIDKRLKELKQSEKKYSHGSVFRVGVDEYVLAQTSEGLGKLINLHCFNRYHNDHIKLPVSFSELSRHVWEIGCDEVKYIGDFDDLYVRRK